MRMARGLLVAGFAALLTAAAQGLTRGPTPRPTPTPWPNEPPSVKLVLPPPAGVVRLSGCGDDVPPVPACTPTGEKVVLRAQATDPDGDTLLYTYTASAGRVSGGGPEVTLDLTGVAPGVYDVSVEVDDGHGGVANDAAKLTVARCICDPPPPPPVQCPTVTVSCPEGRGLIYKAAVTGGDPSVTPTFDWTVSPGTISGGQGTSSITVDPQGASYGVFTATVDVGGYDRSCRTSSSCTFVIEPPLQPRKVDEYGDIPAGDEKLRLDNIAVELQNDPASQLYLICYGGRGGEPRAALRRCLRAKNYLLGRGIDPERVVTLGGGRRESPAVEAWFVPAGAPLPRPSPTVSPGARGRR